jgi:transposase-like protein
VNKDETISLAERVKDEGRSLLNGLIRQGAQRILQAALELEVEEHLAAMGVRPDGRRVAVLNGRLPSREILTEAGALAVEVPRVRHRTEGSWSSAILPKYLRKTPSVEALVGPSARGLSATTVARLTQCWEPEHREW